MSNKQIFNSELVRLQVCSQDKNTLLQEMVHQFFALGLIQTEDDFLHSVMEREDLMSTGVGLGLAVPHGRSRDVPELAAALFRLDPPLEWDAVDGEPVRLVCMVAAPYQQHERYMKLIQIISGAWQDTASRDQLLLADRDTVAALLESWEHEIS